MKYYIIAGEASGDLHASNLMKALLLEDPEAVFRFWGGDKMQEVGGALVKHYKELAFMGFWEVFINLKTILNNIGFCKKDILEYKPDAIIYIDYPGFNLRIAAWAKKQNFKNLYYISPQIWAWKEKRISKIKRDLDALFVILPFEKRYFKEKHNYEVQYVGNPLVDVIQEAIQEKDDFRSNQKLDQNTPLIALLPGSRKQEILKMMPTFIKVIERFPQYKFIVATAPGIDFEWYQQFIKDESVILVQNQTYSLLKNSFAAIVTSGTATLETALFKVPQLVCYRSSFLSFQIAKRIITLPFISLVNLIMNRKVVSEILQNDFTVERIEKELKSITVSEKREKQLKDYESLNQKLSAGGASVKTAKSIVNLLQNKV
ncbi:MAG: lipid-A-disaccharide synthase [Flavobacteriaceae bacterium]|nr:lipid-A-disaccharide synthase [Flavobacteriaceae bacterium]